MNEKNEKLSKDVKTLFVSVQYMNRMREFQTM